jgi:sulfite exporter TauE/SafE
MPAEGLSAHLAAAAAAGLLSSFSHCLGMCGPLVAAFGFSAGPGQGGGRAHPAARAALAQLPYHLGRITTYGVLGAAMGATGAFVNVAGRLAGLSDAVAVGAGLLMVLLGLGAAGVSPLLRRLEARASGRVLAAVRPLLDGGSGRLYPLGLALGVLPCGVSWTVFLGAAASGGPVPGLLMALAFGLGTVPGLLLLGALGALVGQRTRGILYRAGGLLIAVMGALFALRGLGVHAPL